MAQIQALDALLQQLRDIRTKYGDEAYKEAATDIASSLISQGGKQEVFARSAFKDIVDFSKLEATPPVDPALVNPMLKAIQQAMPGVKTQAQLNAVMATFEVVKIWINSVIMGNLDEEAQSRVAFDLALEAVRKATEVTQRLHAVPEASASTVAAECMSTPKEFEEEPLQQVLLAELTGITTVVDLEHWYAEKRPLFDRIVRQDLRNQLFDAIRAKKTPV